MRDIAEIQDRQSLKYVIRHELKDLGIKVPKSKEKNAGGKQLSQKSGLSAVPVFGVSLNDVSTVITNEEYGHTVPSFVVECVEFLGKHLKAEGLFRKSGSQARQKELQRHIESRKPIPSDAHLADVASLFKQFFRQLSDPLLTNRLLNIFIKCQQIGNELDREYATLLLTATMPQIHVNTLSYVMRFLNKVASHAADNKMDSANLAVVLAPNFMSKPHADNLSEKSMVAADKLLKLQTGVVQLLIKNADKIGTVPENVVERVYIVSNKGSDITDRYTSEDELEKSTDLMDPKWRRQGRRKRSKSATIQGLMNGIGNRVRNRKNSCENILQTPGREDVFASPRVEVPLGAETPRILRSSKRKASDESPAGAFSAAKRARSLYNSSNETDQPQWKAMLHKMVIDPRYSKPGLTLHRTPGEFCSPITPLRPPQPPLGEVVTQQGETLNFQSPSIKFADESFTSFSATPAHEFATKSHLSQSYTTPGRKKTKKLNPLSSIKKRRSFGLGDVTPSAQHTPRGMYRSIKRKLGHKPTHSQSLHCPMSPEKVGYRLANEPLPDGLDTLKFDISNSDNTLKFDDLNSDQAIQLRRTPAFRQKHRKAPSSPAMLLTKSFTTCEIAIEDSPHDVSLLNEGLTSVSLLNTSSPKVVVVDMKLDPQAQMYNVKQSGETTPGVQTGLPSGNSDRKAPSKPKRSGNLTPVHTPQDTPKEMSGKKAPNKPRRSSTNLTPVKKNLCVTDMEQNKELEDSPDMPPPKLPPKISITSVDCETKPYEMVPSISQQSISSILSQASVDSVKSTFSIEDCDYPTVVYDDIQVTNTMPCVVKEQHTNSIPAALGAMPSDEEDEENMGAMPSDDEDEENMDPSKAAPGRSLSLESVDSALGAESDMQQNHQRLTKSVSIDSGRGGSIDDLMAMGVLVYKKADGSTIEIESGPAPGSPLVKSMSASNMNTKPFGSIPARLTRSQTSLPAQQQLDPSDTFNASVVRANIQMFNAMSHTDLSTSCSVPVSKVMKKISKKGSAIGRSKSNAVTRRYSLSNDEHYRRVSNSDENLHPATLVRSTGGEIGLYQPLEENLSEYMETYPEDTVSVPPMKTLDVTSEYRDHNDSYETAISYQIKRKNGSLKVSIPDIGSPRRLRQALGDHNVSISPHELEKVAKGVPPLDYHPHRKDPLTPLRLAKSTRVRTAAGKQVTIIRYSPSGRSSPGKAIKRLQSSSASGLHRSHQHHQHPHYHYDHADGAGTSSSKHSQRTPSRKGSRSPKYPQSPVNPLASHQQNSPCRRSSSRLSSIQVHIEEDTEWKI
ncbi:uncharacterized protein [Amphiura filiformis]|uniref:uncharacterized protein isoform X2 n=1 Tax=Amphiura filiformis TaxID=82378 RepID=UPI003B217B18